MQPSLFNQVITQKPMFETMFLNLDYWFSRPLVFWHWITNSSPHFSSTIYLISYLLSFFGITLTIYCVVRLIEIYFEEHEHLKHAIHDYVASQKEMDNGVNPRWTYVENLVNSPNESDWRLAIIEADSILEGLLEEKGIPGVGIGERLKNISPGDLNTLQSAWEAHLVRNRIAHEGSDFEVTERDAKKTIRLYEMVFQELGFC
jgi:hypothetical protein